MFVARVTGAVVSTQKVSSMTGHKLLVVEPYRLDEKARKSLVTTGRTFIAVDTLGAGEGDYVLITQGSSARLTPETKELPIKLMGASRYQRPISPRVSARITWVVSCGSAPSDQAI